jgi:hypothetical protein
VLPAATKDPAPFMVHVPQAALDDLKKRLAAARWPDKGPAAEWSQGVPLAKAQALVEYWRTRYDWRRAESSLNGLPQFRTQIDGLGIHFIHVRSKHENALPIILTHGWPGSFIEFLQVIGPLVDPTAHGGKADKAFHVVIPSLPGFGFSDKPTEVGWRLPRIANAWAALMARLGYSRYSLRIGAKNVAFQGVIDELATPRPVNQPRILKFLYVVRHCRLADVVPATEFPAWHRFTEVADVLKNAHASRFGQCLRDQLQLPLRQYNFL